MAVYTDIPDDELALHLERYNIGELHAIKGIAEGVENSNFLITTDNGTYILTLYEKRVDPADLPFFLGLMKHLSSKGITCPEPIEMRSGESLAQLAGRPAAIVSFLDGISLRRPSSANCRQAGEVLAKMHVAARDFDIRRENALGLAGWRPLFENSRKGADGVLAGLTELVETEIGYLEANWPAKLPAGVIHADMFPDNVLFLKNQLSGVIDFYFACNDLLALDIAICLNAWCFEPDWSFNVTKAGALLAGYQSVRALTQEEYDALPLLCRGSALRFLLTRLYDWLNVPPNALVTPKDPSEYIAKLRFHQGVKSPGEYGLHQLPLESK